MYSGEGIMKIAPIVYLLLELRKSKQMISVITTHGVHENMVITDLEINNADGYKDTVVCDIDFEECKFATTDEAYVSLVHTPPTTKSNSFNVGSAIPKSGGISTQYWK
jgi:purine-nucleoside phosphorylase